MICANEVEKELHLMRLADLAAIEIARYLVEEGIVPNKNHISVNDITEWSRIIQKGFKEPQLVEAEY